MTTGPSTPSRFQSKIVPGPPDLRYYPRQHLIAWQPQGVLDDKLLENIAEWLVNIETVSLPFNRFVDFSRLTVISISARHVFDFARKRLQQFAGAAPIRTALFGEEWICFGVARLYEALMADSPIQVQAFRDRSGAAAWLNVPAEILELKDEPPTRL